MTVAGRTYSTADHSLRPSGAASASSGSDSLGDFTAHTQKWSAGATPYTTTARLYGAKFAVFEQVFPEGAEGTNISSANVSSTQGSASVSSCFPSIDQQPSRPDEALGYVWWGGRSFLEGSKGGTWNPSKHGPGVGTGEGSGPFVPGCTPLLSRDAAAILSTFKQRDASLALQHG